MTAVCQQEKEIKIIFCLIIIAMGLKPFVMTENLILFHIHR